MIVPPRHLLITKKIFKKFLNDFFVSCSYVTNIYITPEIKDKKKSSCKLVVIRLLQKAKWSIWLIVKELYDFLLDVKLTELQ